MAHRCQNGCGNLIPSNDWHAECEECRRIENEMIKLLQEERNEQERTYHTLES